MPTTGPCDNTWKTASGLAVFHKKWLSIENKSKTFLEEFISESDFGELRAVKKILDSLPQEGNLHLANSMPVRLANFIGLQPAHEKIRIVANRGTSGIDGSNSTAVGEALASDEQVILLTGDMAFFYDRNAFWHNYPLPNLRVILLTIQIQILN